MQIFRDNWIGLFVCFVLGLSACSDNGDKSPEDSALAETTTSETTSSDTPPSDGATTTSSVCSPQEGACMQGGSCVAGNICANGSNCEDYCFCKEDGTWECALVRQHPCGCTNLDGFCQSNDGCNWCACEDNEWKCTASACSVDVPDMGATD